jgi:hypothetical protein
LYRKADPRINCLFLKFGVDVEKPDFIRGYYTEAFPEKYVEVFKDRVRLLKQDGVQFRPSKREYPDSALTWYQLEEQYGKCLYKHQDIADRLGISVSALSAYKKASNVVDDMFFKIGKDVMQPSEHQKQPIMLTRYLKAQFQSYLL